MKKSRVRPKQSCAECRRLKLRCDKTSWPCVACVSRGCGEICPEGTLPPLGRTSRAKLEREALGVRVDALESILLELGAGHRIPPPLDFPSKDAAPAPGQPPVAAGDETLLVSGVGSLTIDEERGSVRFLGASAGSAFFPAEDLSASDSEDDVDPISQPSPGLSFPYPSTNVTPLVVQSSSKAVEIEALRAILPARDEAERLARNYYANVSFMFEPIEEAQLFDEYLPAAYTSGNAQGSQLACVFAVLALGLLFDRDCPSTYNPQANHYFLLSQATLASSRFLSSATIASAQTLQISGNFLFNQTHRLKENGEQFYPLLGIGIRQLFSMGLHRDPSNWGITGVELERRRLLFYELMTLDRLQAFISGRPYMIQQAHFDTKVPASAGEYQIWKWKLGVFLHRVIDECFSVQPPTHGMVTQIDQELRDMFEKSPSSLRSGVLPTSAFAVRPIGPPSFPVPPPPSSAPVKQTLQNFTLDMVFLQILFYLHKPAFSQALRFSEPLQSGPLSASVNAVVLETGPSILVLAKEWIAVDPVLCPRWWHIFFHAFAVSVSMASLVVQCPTSILARHSWDQLHLAVEIFQSASRDGAPVAMLLPRVEALRDQALASIQSAMGLPSTVSAPEPRNDSDQALVGYTRLSRKPRKSSSTPERETSVGVSEAGFFRSSTGAGGDASRPASDAAFREDTQSANRATRNLSEIDALFSLPPVVSTGESPPSSASPPDASFHSTFAQQYPQHLYHQEPPSSGGYDPYNPTQYNLQHHFPTPPVSRRPSLPSASQPEPNSPFRFDRSAPAVPFAPPQRPSLTSNQHRHTISDPSSAAAPLRRDWDGATPSAAAFMTGVTQDWSHPDPNARPPIPLSHYPPWLEPGANGSE